jgi:hypothetical protein
MANRQGDSGLPAQSRAMEMALKGATSCTASGLFLGALKLRVSLDLAADLCELISVRTKAYK